MPCSRKRPTRHPPGNSSPCFSKNLKICCGEVLLFYCIHWYNCCIYKCIPYTFYIYIYCIACRDTFHLSWHKKRNRAWIRITCCSFRYHPFWFFSCNHWSPLIYVATVNDFIEHHSKDPGHVKHIRIRSPHFTDFMHGEILHNHIQSHLPSAHISQPWTSNQVTASVAEEHLSNGNWMKMAMKGWTAAN